MGHSLGGGLRTPSALVIVVVVVVAAVVVVVVVSSILGLVELFILNLRADTKQTDGQTDWVQLVMRLYRERAA